MPHIVEFKTAKRKDRFQYQGRLGRQLHRMQKTVEYLNHGTAKFDNELAIRMVIESDIHPDYDFEQVESIASSAIHNGASVQMVRPGQWIGACRLDSKPIFPTDLMEHTDLPVVSGFVSDTLPEFVNEVPPPFNWPINFNIRYALMEGELSMFHLIDLRLLQDQRIRVLPDITFEVLVDRDWFHLSDYFLRRIIYGFESPISVVKTMINLAEKASKLGLGQV